MFQLGKVYRYIPDHNQYRGPGHCSSESNEDSDLKGMRVEITGMSPNGYVRGIFIDKHPTLSSQDVYSFAQSALKRIGHKNLPDRSGDD